MRVLQAETIEAAAQEQPLAHAEGTAGEFGLGYQLLGKLKPDLGQSTQSICHTGMGGSIGLADPAKRFAFGCVINQMFSDRLLDLLTATFESLDA